MPGVLGDDRVSLLLDQLVAKAKATEGNQQQQQQAQHDVDEDDDSEYNVAESPSTFVQLRSSPPASTEFTSEKRLPTALDKVDSIMEKGDSIVSNLLRTKSTIREVLHTGNTIVRIGFT